MISSDRIHRLGGFLLRVCLAGLLGMILLVESVSLMDPANVIGMLTIIPGLVAVALVLAGEKPLPSAALLAGGLSIAFNVAVLLSSHIDGRCGGVAETGALLVLLVWTVRRWNFPLGKWGVGILSVGLLSLPTRSGAVFATIFLDTLLFPFIAVAIAMGVYFYNLDSRRQRALGEVRRGERMELARELHDFVAHHVTGIVVRAQAAQYLPADSPEKNREAFQAIEHAGVEALTSMRRLVAMMREEGEEAQLRPLGDLEQTADLVERFSSADTHAAMYVAGDVDGAVLPPEVVGTVHRVVRECLTNIRKHAPAATSVTVSISRANGYVETVIYDDGNATRRAKLAHTGGGFGLAGLRERAEAIDGEFAAGPRPEGGWEVRMRLPYQPEQEGDSGADDGLDR